jgi:hypothetical protein
MKRTGYYIPNASSLYISPHSLIFQYLYVELATKERPHHHAGNQTTALQHAKDVKDMVSEVR